MIRKPLLIKRLNECTVSYRSLPVYTRVERTSIKYLNKQKRTIYNEIVRNLMQNDNTHDGLTKHRRTF